MNDKIKLDIDAESLVSLASSLTLCLAHKYSLADLCVIRQFLSTICSNLSLYEFQQRLCQSTKDKK